MGFDLKIEPRQTYLYAAFAGRFDLADAKGHVQTLFDTCASMGCSKVLADARGVEGPLSVGERYEYANLLVAGQAAHLAAGHGLVRVAYLGDAGLLDSARLGETVARNRGVEVKVTTDPAEAATFLGIDLESLS